MRAISQLVRGHGSGHMVNSRLILVSWCILTALLLSGCPQKVVVKYYGAPSLVPGTTPEMNTAGFWIGRHAAPDLLVMTAGEIDAFNAYIKEKTKAVNDVTRLSPTRNGMTLQNSMKRMIAYVASKNYVDADGRPADEMLGSLEILMAIDTIPATVTVRWAYVVRPCDQRLLPTAEPLFKSSMDTAIDRLQNNALDLATPVVVVHESADNAWFYVIAPYSDGWVRADCIALCPLEQVERYEAWSSFVVATAAKADLFGDPLLRDHLATVQMGVKLPLLQGMSDECVQVLIPTRSDGGWCVFDAAYVSASLVHRGYLPYTPRNAITQAFRFLNAPYGWGGMYGEQDCSRFVQEIFACFGILMPRSSSQQARVGMLRASFDKNHAVEQRHDTLLSSAMGGITTLQFPGHIMLYLGDIDGEPYAIHDLYAYAEPLADDERLISINKVAVTSLALGEGTKNGCLLMRLPHVREISPELSEK